MRVRVLFFVTIFCLVFGILTKFNIKLHDFHIKQYRIRFYWVKPAWFHLFSPLLMCDSGRSAQAMQGERAEATKIEC